MLHPLASELDYEKGVLAWSAPCISVQQSTRREGPQMQELRRTVTLRPMSWGSMPFRCREWWWRVPSVHLLGCLSTSKRRKKLYALAFMQRVHRERCVLRFGSQFVEGKPLADRPENKIAGISQQSVRKLGISHNAGQHHAPHQGRDDGVSLRAPLFCWYSF